MRFLRAVMCFIKPKLYFSFNLFRGENILSVANGVTRNMHMDESQLKLYYETALDLTRGVGKMIQEHHKKSKNILTKTSSVDLVTETDQRVEKHLVSSLLEKFPEHKYIGEESVADGQLIELTDNPTWIIDPIDGTMNFIHGYPNFCISIGLWIKKKPYIGIVYNPILELMFTAQIGKGAFLNGNCISTSSVTELDKALMLTEFGNTRSPESMSMVMENLRRLLPLTHGVRVCGASALNIAMVAMGGADVFYQAGLYIWDLAAGVLLVQEAGGFVSDPAGGKLDPLNRQVLVASTEELARKVIPHIKLCVVD